MIKVIPKPTQITPGEVVFAITPDTAIIAGTGTEPEARYLAEALTPAMGFQLKMASGKTSNAISFALDASLAQLGDEGYKLDIKQDQVAISAFKPAGLFYACQTIRQLLPNDVFSSAVVNGVEWAMPCLSIEDKPRFGWRGHLFDCGRHFFSIESIKRSIDLMALHKLNRLHWHLTEDQGWRIQIKRYPLLTEVGAWRTEEDGSRYGGYYTQAEVREIVEYAAARHIEVVPEIEMPGHSLGALTAYPEFGCTGGPYQVPNKWGVFKEVYCAGDDATFVFLQNILDEVLELFPSTYIHIGGDECPKDSWASCEKCQTRIKENGLKDEHELQSYFIKRIDAYLTSKGRRLVGWDEVLEGGLAPNAVVQSWRGIDGGVEAAEADHDVVMSPYQYCYVDYPYDDNGTSVEKAYSYEPIPDALSAGKEKHILGIEANMWTEHVPDQNKYDYQTYPRMTALSEVAWSQKQNREWADFSQRLDTHLRRLDLLGVKYGG